MATRSERVASAIASAPESAKGCLNRAFSGSGGRANAIKAMCLTCVGYEREAIRNCTGFSCPLWLYRPFQEADPKPFVCRGAGEEGLLCRTSCGSKECEAP